MDLRDIVDFVDFDFEDVDVERLDVRELVAREAFCADRSATNIAMSNRAENSRRFSQNILSPIQTTQFTRGFLLYQIQPPVSLFVELHNIIGKLNDFIVDEAKFA